ncbi:STAS-like domain-containing protein [Sphingomonas sp. OTU376]|uniref:STAS-like domain-containing protein n=1 Tax=Sphingomonas sp. OTU376 TaxID=3043863 RepID=UPI00313A7607
MLKLGVARDFSPDPGPRKASQGQHSGEAFRRLLMRKLAASDLVEVDLDGTSGFGSSWLDEVFGGLIRDEGMSAAEVRRRVRVKSIADETYLFIIEEAINLARPRDAAAPVAA